MVLNPPPEPWAKDCAQKIVVANLEQTEGAPTGAIMGIPTVHSSIQELRSAASFSKTSQLPELKLN